MQSAENTRAIQKNEIMEAHPLQFQHGLYLTTLELYNYPNLKQTQLQFYGISSYQEGSLLNCTTCRARGVWDKSVRGDAERYGGRRA